MWRWQNSGTFTVRHPPDAWSVCGRPGVEGSSASGRVGEGEAGGRSSTVARPPCCPLPDSNPSHHPVMNGRHRSTYPRYAFVPTVRPCLRQECREITAIPRVKVMVSTCRPAPTVRTTATARTHTNEARRHRSRLPARHAYGAARLCAVAGVTRSTWPPRRVHSPATIAAALMFGGSVLGWGTKARWGNRQAVDGWRGQ